MELPLAVRQALGDSAQRVSLTTVRQADSLSALRMLLLSDEQGSLQVICRKHDLIDLEQLNQQLGRDFRLMELPEQRRIMERTGLSELPALPSLTELPTVVDFRVRDLETVVLELAGDNLAIVMAASDFRPLAEAAWHCSFAVDPALIPAPGKKSTGGAEQFHSSIKKFTALRIQQRLEDTLELPPMPETAQRIVHIRVDPNAVMGDLVDVVESDPSLAAQVVSWASSSFYGAAGHVRSVHDAVSRVLGFDLVMNLAMGLSMGRGLKQSTDGPENYTGYWRRALWQAQSAGVLASMMPRGTRPTFGLAYLAGLLHNFGELALAQIFPPHHRLVSRAQEVNPHFNPSVIEYYLLGISRNDVAARLMESWGMPEEVILAIRHQNDPSYQGPHQVYPKLLWLCQQQLAALGVTGRAAEEIPEAFYDELGLQPDRVIKQFQELLKGKDSILAVTGNSDTPPPGL
ncbi:aminoacyl-tRNA deacylase and HDOD domain-containing protein [Marinobacter pelagius]|uniref:HD-like signal output (HDOD) domain, no enzymatic activity n=1 Tax=Marinobacter pelagius TaxID=379482 RepID=A0A1I4QBY5_9GAMM|nr:HDOD domain-containing protein [Marinobacter pelagius]SFM37534.1 HD-like signal output (HDOD) domain, no enzymatic activity [Marinobacter pelagius]